LRGGFPRSLLAPTNRESFEWRDNFLRTCLERDIPQLGPRIPAETLRRFWTMLAHTQGGILNASQLAGNLCVSGTTVARYLDLMVDLLLVCRLQPWFSNTGKRLIRSPKVYVRDSGIVHALLHIQTINDLLGHPVVGGSWEGFVIENILSKAPAYIIPFFFTELRAERKHICCLNFQIGKDGRLRSSAAQLPHYRKVFTPTARM